VSQQNVSRPRSYHRDKRRDNPMLIVSDRESMGEKKDRGITRVECIAQERACASLAGDLEEPAWCLSTSACAKDGRLNPLSILQPMMYVGIPERWPRRLVRGGLKCGGKCYVVVRETRFGDDNTGRCMDDQASMPSCYYCKPSRQRQVAGQSMNDIPGRPFVYSCVL
jgi:hypothetical protein